MDVCRETPKMVRESAVRVPFEGSLFLFERIIPVLLSEQSRVVHIVDVNSRINRNKFAVSKKLKEKVNTSVNYSAYLYKKIRCYIYWGFLNVYLCLLRLGLL